MGMIHYIRHKSKARILAGDTPDWVKNSHRASYITRVCGLTVPWNIQVVPWDLNGAKGNNWCPEQDDLFPETLEQS